MLKIDRLIRSRRKSISLTIHPDGSLVVRAPLHTSEKLIRQWVETKQDWVTSRQDKILSNAAKLKPKLFIDGETFLFLGQAYPLQIVPGARESLSFDVQFKLASRWKPRAAQVFEKWYKAQALTVFTERTAWFAAHYGFTYTRVHISSARTRWGSCSSLGTISFTWRLIMAPQSVIDYVIIHELVHTVEKNHAPAFWNKVAAIIPDYKEKRAWLKKNGQTLTLN